MQKYYRRIAFFLAITILPFIGFSQTQLTNTPRASQRAGVMQRIGLTDVAISYHRPAAKERDIWGQLVPDNAIWRAGANENTTITFSKDVKIEGKALKAGTYGLFVLPVDGKSKVIFSNNSTSWGHFSYNKQEDALQVEVDMAKTAHFYEWVTFEFDQIERTKASCNLKWGDKKIPFVIEADVDNNTVASLREELRDRAGFSWQGWHEAATYCLRNNVNLIEALTWANRSVFMSPNPRNMQVKAQIAGKLKGNGDKKEEARIAVNVLETDLNSQPCTWKEFNAAATFATKNEVYDKALTFAEKSISMNGNMTNMMSKVAILTAKGEEKKASKYKKEAIAKGSNAALNAYGYQLTFSGKTAEAVEIFEANSVKNPKDPNVWDSLCEGYARNGQKEAAIKAGKKSLTLNPSAAVKTNTLKTLRNLGVDVENMKP